MNITYMNFYSIRPGTDDFSLKVRVADCEYSDLTML